MIKYAIGFIALFFVVVIAFVVIGFWRMPQLGVPLITHNIHSGTENFSKVLPRGNYLAILTLPESFDPKKAGDIQIQTQDSSALFSLQSPNDPSRLNKYIAIFSVKEKNTVVSISPKIELAPKETATLIIAHRK